MSFYGRVWQGGEGTGDMIDFIGPSMGVSPRRTDDRKPPKTVDPNKLRGKIVRYFESRGFGFIEPEDGDKDVWFHVSSTPEGMTIRRGLNVAYDIHRDIRTGKTSAVNLEVVR